jgi:hypothetical protein
MNLGNYPDKSLETEHGDYRKALESVKNGIDPQAPPPESSEASSEPEILTVADLKVKYVGHTSHR